MAKIIPNQSGMDFIADNTLHIEESELYKNVGEGVRSVEFVRIKDGNLLPVEARTTFPNPNNPCKDNKARFQNEIDEICDKFMHSLNMLSSIELGVTAETYPDDFLLPEETSLVFMLVVKNHEFKWLGSIKNKIEANLARYLKNIWRPKVLVLNQNAAIKQGLVVG